MTASHRADDFRSHWWWRPGWQVGTRYYAWHLIFDDQPAVQRLARAYWPALQSAVLDPVPLEWLHLTTQGVGHVADVPPAGVDRMVDAVRLRLAEVSPPTAVFGPAEVTHEGVEVAPVDREPVRAVHRAIRAGMTDALGANAVPGRGETFWPHVSLAYANAVAPSTPVRQALAGFDVPTTEVTFSRATLIELHRDHRVYEWRVVSRAAIGA